MRTWFQNDRGVEREVIQRSKIKNKDLSPIGSKLKLLWARFESCKEIEQKTIKPLSVAFHIPAIDRLNGFPGPIRDAPVRNVLGAP